MKNNFRILRKDEEIRITLVIIFLPPVSQTYFPPMGGSSVSKGLDFQTQDLRLIPHKHKKKKPRAEVYDSNLSAREVETGRSLHSLN